MCSMFMHIFVPHAFTPAVCLIWFGPGKKKKKINCCLLVLVQFVLAFYKLSRAVNMMLYRLAGNLGGLFVKRFHALLTGVWGEWLWSLKSCHVSGRHCSGQRINTIPSKTALHPPTHKAKRTQLNTYMQIKHTQKTCMQTLKIYICMLQAPPYAMDAKNTHAHSWTHNCHAEVRQQLKVTPLL